MNHHADYGKLLYNSTNGKLVSNANGSLVYRQDYTAVIKGDWKFPTLPFARTSDGSEPYRAAGKQLSNPSPIIQGMPESANILWIGSPAKVINGGDIFPRNRSKNGFQPQLYDDYDNYDGYSETEYLYTVRDYGEFISYMFDFYYTGVSFRRNNSTTHVACNKITGVWERPDFSTRQKSYTLRPATMSELTDLGFTKIYRTLGDYEFDTGLYLFIGGTFLMDTPITLELFDDVSIW